MKTKTLILLFGLFLLSTEYGKSQTHISGKIDNFQSDTIKIVLQINSITRQSETILIPVINGKFKQELKIRNPTFIYTTDGTNYVSGLIEPDDHIAISYDANNSLKSLNFTGKGSNKFSFLNSLIQFKIYNKLKEQTPIARQKKYPFDHMFKFIDSVGFSFRQQLNAIKSSMTSESFNLLNASLKATIMGSKNKSLGLIYHESFDETLTKRQNELTNESKNTLQNTLKFDNSLYYSSSYVNEVYNTLFSYYDWLVLTNKKDRDIIKKYKYLDSHLPKKLKIPVLTLFIENDIDIFNQNEDIETVIHKTYTSPKDSLYQNFITRRYNDATRLKKGMDAPDFVLENERGEKITLATFKGKVIFLDFWYAACGPCHALFESIKPVKKHYESNDKVVFLTVSIDSKKIWMDSLDKYNLEGYQAFTENREENHQIIKSYKVAGYPTTCLIDKNGKIFLTNPSNSPQELQQQIENALTIDSN